MSMSSCYYASSCCEWQTFLWFFLYKYENISNGKLQERRSVVESAQLASLSTLSVKIIARTQNPLSTQDEPSQMLHGEIATQISTQLSDIQLSGDLSGVLAIRAELFILLFDSVLYILYSVICLSYF